MAKMVFGLRSGLQIPLAIEGYPSSPISVERTFPSEDCLSHFEGPPCHPHHPRLSHVAVRLLYLLLFALLFQSTPKYFQVHNSLMVARPIRDRGSLTEVNILIRPS